VPCRGAVACEFRCQKRIVLPSCGPALARRGARRAGLVRGSLGLGHLHRAGPPSVCDGLNDAGRRRKEKTTRKRLWGIWREFVEVAAGSVRVLEK